MGGARAVCSVPFTRLGLFIPPKSLNYQEIRCFYSIYHVVSMLAPRTANLSGTTGPLGELNCDYGGKRQQTNESNALIQCGRSQSHVVPRLTRIGRYLAA